MKNKSTLPELKNKLSFEDHVKIDSRLKEIYDYLSSLDYVLKKVYGCNSFFGIGFDSTIASGSVGLLRSKIDEHIDGKYRDTSSSD